jgi:hypothetical protein
MRLTHFAFALTFVLIAITGYLAFDAQQEARDAKKEVDMLKRQTQAQIAAGAVTQMPQIRSIPPPEPGQFSAVPAPAAPLTIPAGTGVASVPPLGRPSVAQGGGAPMTAAPSVTSPQTEAAPPSPAPGVPATPAITPLQRQILGMPVLGQVTSYHKDGGFVVIGAGKRQQLAPGMKFDIRRGGSIVGRVTLTTVEDAESVGDLDPRSVPAGVIVETGDEVIQMVNAL